MSKNFQEIILTLQQYWAQKGCILWQPYSEKVGAGTMNPATVLRVLGPESWNVAYTEPSYRPDDGRFGDNPNRMQMHTQFQVILKPDPGNPQELYLESLAAIGIHMKDHDIRFVEDNWESPALGAWGLGWEVWLNGMEITQFTYFQQAASQTLPVPAVEITYGLERIVMFLQGVDSVWDIDWNGQLTYRDIYLASEIDHCHYDFNQADRERLLEMYKLFEQEALHCIEQGLVAPAHDYVLRCSHTFNVLDARGAIGVTERAYYFGKMRDLARKVGSIYIKQREELEYPLKSTSLQSSPELPTSEPIASEKEDFLFEVGCEELPADEVDKVAHQWRQMVPEILEKLRLENQGFEVHSTPRRLVLSIPQLAGKQKEQTLTLTGPPVRISYNDQGELTPAGLGFAKSQRCQPEDLFTQKTDKGEYLAVEKTDPGESSVQLLSTHLLPLLEKVTFKRSMRWDTSSASFSRPVRWILALHGETLVPLVYADLVSQKTTYGPRPLLSPSKEVQNPTDYFKQLKKWGILLNNQQRREQIVEQAQKLADQVNGKLPDDISGLLDEVTNLVEVPVALLGSFEKEFLALPACVVTTVMKKHQRYLPILQQSGEPMAHFIAIANGVREDQKLVTKGYESVLRARYADATFFVEQDLKQPLQNFSDKLKTLTFQDKLGSMYDKQERIATLATWLAGQLSLSPDQLQEIEQAAQLCKTDLATSMVVEMTSLQGTLGEVYALKNDLPQGVAQAIREHYLPRNSEDSLPTQLAGSVIGVADRLDSLAGLFSVGLKPTGSADPYGLRRAALGLIQLLQAKHLAPLHTLDLRELFTKALEIQPQQPEKNQKNDLLGFVEERQRVFLKGCAQKLSHDVVVASLAVHAHQPARAFEVACQLQTTRQTQENWEDLFTSLSRCHRMTKKNPLEKPYQEIQDPEPSAQELLAGLKAFDQEPQTVQELFANLTELQPKIDSFFDNVLVMDKDPQIKKARLGLVHRVADMARPLADFSLLEGY